MNAYNFLMIVDDEYIFRARKALNHILAGEWVDAANQYTQLSLEMTGDYKKTAEQYAEQCKNNARFFQRPMYR